MSMLADRKTKQKLSLNPRGTQWSNDVNKFGQKMLEKMGWSTGKGLGAKEDGVTEHVKVKYKNDSSGMGFKERDDQWTSHESKFSALLNSLSAGNDELSKPSASLEDKSRKSKARVHYHKFTRGKDLSSRTEKELANILGRKTLKKEESSSESLTDSEETNGKEFGVKTLEGGNMQDYFKAKLNQLKLSQSGCFKEESSSESSTDSEEKTNIKEVRNEDIQNYFQSKLNQKSCLKEESSSESSTDSEEENNKEMQGGIMQDYLKSKLTENTCLKEDSSSESSSTDSEEKSSHKKVQLGNSQDDLKSKLSQSLADYEEEANNKKGRLITVQDYLNSKMNQSKLNQKQLPDSDIQRVGVSFPSEEDLEFLEIIRNFKEKSERKRQSKAEIEELSVSKDTSKKSKKKLKNSALDNLDFEIDRKRKRKAKVEESAVPEQTPKKSKKMLKEFAFDNLGLEADLKEEVCYDNAALEVNANEEQSDEVDYEEVEEQLVQKKSKLDKKIKSLKPKKVEGDKVEKSQPKKSKEKVKKSSEIDAVETALTFLIGELKTRKKLLKKQSQKQTDEEPKSPKKLLTKKKKVPKEVESAKNLTKSASPGKKLKKKKKQSEGIDNPACEINTVEEDVANINKELDNYQNELENTMNQQKDKKVDSGNQQKDKKVDSGKLFTPVRGSFRGRGRGRGRGFMHTMNPYSVPMQANPFFPYGMHITHFGRGQFYGIGGFSGRGGFPGFRGRGGFPEMGGFGGRGGFAVRGTGGEFRGAFNTSYRSRGRFNKLEKLKNIDPKKVQIKFKGANITKIAGYTK